MKQLDLFNRVVDGKPPWFKKEENDYQRYFLIIIQIVSPVGDNKLIILCHGVERYLYIIADVNADVEVGVEHYS